MLSMPALFLPVKAMYTVLAAYTSIFALALTMYDYTRFVFYQSSRLAHFEHFLCRYTILPLFTTKLSSAATHGLATILKSQNLATYRWRPTDGSLLPGKPDSWDCRRPHR